MDSDKFNFNFEYLANYEKKRRREDATIFDVIFHDTELLVDDDICEAVARVATFFKMDAPKIVPDEKAIAQVEFSTLHDQLQKKLKYNIQNLKKQGFNNKDSVIACMCHELSHIYSFGRTYGYCKNELWEAELYADFMTSYIITKIGVAGGKYRYIVSQGKATLTHPYGTIRKDCSESARHYVEMHPKMADENEIDEAEGHFLLFLLTHAKEINNYLEEHNDELLHSLDPKPPTKVDIFSLPDTNLIKQAALKLKINGK